jgi:hypothetical protein
MFKTEIPLRGEKANFYKFLHQNQEECHNIMDADWRPKLDKLMIKQPILEDLPFENDTFYSTLFTKLSPAQVADIFGAMLLE